MDKKWKKRLVSLRKITSGKLEYVFTKKIQVEQKERRSLCKIF